VDRNSHILNAASNLLGIALLIITGIHITDNAGKSPADETALAAAILLTASCVVSYLSIRSKERGEKLEELADKIFLGGLAALVLSVGILVVAFR
jgi:hypothetical protein